MDDVSALTVSGCRSRMTARALIWASVRSESLHAELDSRLSRRTSAMRSSSCSTAVGALVVGTLILNIALSICSVKPPRDGLGPLLGLDLGDPHPRRPHA